MHTLFALTASLLQPTSDAEARLDRQPAVTKSVAADKGDAVKTRGKRTDPQRGLTTRDLDRPNPARASGDDARAEVEEPIVDEELYGDAYDIVLEPTVVDGFLVLTVAYGGGCSEHLFEPVFYDQRDDRLDVLELDLVHDAGDDMCRALLQTELSFDLRDELPACEAAQLELNTHHGTWIVEVPVDRDCR